MPIKAHKIKLNPTPAQENYFYCGAGVARFAWNWALDEYKRRKAAGAEIDWNDIKRAFRARIAIEFPFVGEVTKCAAEEAIHDLRKAINVYHKTRAANPNSKVKFPGYRRRSKKVGGFGLANDKFSVDDHTARIPKLGEVNLAEALRFSGKILSGRVTERAGRWYLTITVECITQPAASPRDSVGIDFGLKSFATLSTGEVAENQSHFRQAEGRVKGLSRGLARKQKGSRKRAKWKRKLARAHEHVSNQRKDFLHKFTAAVSGKYAVVCVEDLNLAGLCQTRLAKSFGDAGIGEAVRQLEYKAAWTGGVVQKVGRFFPSSKLCADCGTKNDALKLSEREWTCSHCGRPHDRDLNAALNIKLEGTRLLAGSVATSASTPVDVKALACAAA